VLHEHFNEIYMTYEN